MVFNCLKVSNITEEVVQVNLNRPGRMNAMTREMVKELRTVFTNLSQDRTVRAIILTGDEKAFCAGMDFKDFQDYKGLDPARKGLNIIDDVKMIHECVNTIEDCRKPVIAVDSGACIGIGLEFIAACCIRICSKKSVFQIKEVSVGITANVGALTRLPKIIGCESWIRELAYTGRIFKAEEATRHGLFSQMHEDYTTSMQAAIDIAKEIASKSPVAVIGTKSNLNFSRDHTVKEGLEFVMYWSAFALQTDDYDISVRSIKEKKKLEYPKL